MTTQLTAESSPVLDIEVFECEACGSKAEDLSYRRPLNSLEGRIRLSSKAELHLSHVEVSFQGSQSTAVVALKSNSKDIVTLNSTERFLDIAYKPTLESIRKTECQDGLRIYSLDFSFVIPQGADFLGELPPQCQLLPPSLGVAGCFMSSYDQKTRPRAAVAYNLRASIDYRKANATDTETPKTIEDTKRVGILPYNEVQPPTNTASFPGEFVMHVASPVWKHLLGARLGTVTMTTNEPLPLAYISATSIDCTECVLALSVDAPPDAIQRLGTLSLEIKPAIRTKTFYSAEKIPCIPKQTHLTQTGTLRLHDSVLKLERRKFQNLEWQYVPQNVQQDSPPRYEALMSQANYNSGSRSSVSSTGKVGLWRRVSRSSDSTVQNASSIWRSSVRIPISPSQTLLPTFCSKLVARSYSVLLRVDMAGVCTKRADFEVPLQVVHLSSTRHVDMHSTPPQDSSPCLGVTTLLAQYDILPTYESLTHQSPIYQAGASN